MTPDEMLEILNEMGDCNDYNDDERVMGWFTWAINTSTGMLTVTYEQRPDEMPLVSQSQSWLLIDPVEFEKWAR